MNIKTKYDSVKSAYLTDDDFINVSKELDSQYFRSGLKCFADHNGFRNGEVHTFVGTKGSGKSTWCKTMLSEITWQDKSTLLCISEEDTPKYVYNINKMFRRNTKTANDVEKYLENIIVISEMEEEINSENEFFDYLENLISNLELDIFIYDNYTTSFLSELPINQQSKILRRFKLIAKKYNIPVIIFFHTSKNYDPSSLDGDSVRGSGTAINIGSYNYVIYQYKDSAHLRNFIHTEKARYHNRANKKIYEALYNYELGVFTETKHITSIEYNQIIGKRK